ncbi:MAG TPA: ABC transporter permease [Terriglobales bacterium]|nr:ABC transporter permease [Terriglobales bacterium]
MSRLRTWFMLPSWIWLWVLFVAPFAIVLAYSLLTRGPYGGLAAPWTLENYQRLVDPLYMVIMLRSFIMAAVATALCLVLAFPLALFISRAGKRKNLYLQLVILPFWTSFLVRTYAWLFLLRDTGLVNTVLQHLHIISAPLPLLYNDGAVLLGLVYGFLPFMVLPIYATLEKMDESLLEAAADLGCPRWRAFWLVTVPLSVPGVIAGFLLCFIPIVGEFVIPDLLGGSETMMIGQTLWTEFFSNRDWPVASAVAVALLCLLLVPIVVYQHIQMRALERGR